MIDRSKLSPAGEETMVEIEAQLGALCEMLKASVIRFRRQSRREQRRARKARKNLVMYKLAGRRPWDCGPFGEVLDSLTRQLGDGMRLHERSGFADMSRRAEGMR